jgi:hypothetical protein
MEEATNKRTVPDIKDEGKGKQGWGSRIYTFLASGGLILVLIGGFIIAVIIASKLS